MEGITNLERSALGVSLDSRPTEGAPCLEPLEQSVLISSLAVRPIEGITEKVSDWKPVINPVISYTLDSGLMEGITYHDSGPTEGASCPEPLEQWVFSSSLAARPVKGVVDKVSDRKPVINPVQDITPDGRPMEGTAYPEHSALGVSLDSGLRAGMSSIEPVRKSVLNTCFKSSARPMLDHAIVMHIDVDDDIDTDLPENPALMMNSQTNHEQSWFESSAGPMLDHAIVNHTDVDDDIDTDLPENPAPMRNSQTYHKQSWFESSARPMLDPDKVHNTVVNADVNTDLPENSAPMMNLDLRLWQSDTHLCPPVADTLDRRPMEGISSRLLVNSPGLTLAPDSGYLTIWTVSMNRSSVQTADSPVWNWRTPAT